MSSLVAPRQYQLNQSVHRYLRELMAPTDNRGPDSCIAAVSCEASVHGVSDVIMDKVNVAAF